MEKEKIQIENEKKAYEKPMLIKHGKLRDVTAAASSGINRIPALGCTRF